MAKNLAQIKAKHVYTDKDGKVRDRTLNIPHYFKDIPKIYSPNLKNGYMDFCPKAKWLYCYFQGWENSGNFCYERQEELADMIDLSRERTSKLLSEMQKAGLITKEKNPGYRSKVYRTFPITDAHITPPDQLSAAPESDVVRQQPEPMPAPEPAKAAEEKADVAPNWDAWDAPEYLESPAPVQALSTQQDKPELPWGGRKAFKTNGDVADEGVKWALTETMGDEEKAYQLLSRVLSEYFGRTEVIIPRSPEVYDDFEDIPF